MPVDTQAPALGVVREEYLRALLEADVPRARTVLGDAVSAGTPVRSVYLDVLQPTLYEVGRRWSHAEISVAQEHRGTAATQSAMARLAAMAAELVGGQAFGGSAEPALRTGADAYAGDAAEAARIMHERFA